MRTVALRPDHGKQIPPAQGRAGLSHIAPILPLNYTSSHGRESRNPQPSSIDFADGEGCTGKLSAKSPTKRFTRLPASKWEVCTPFPRIIRKPAEGRQ